MPARTIKKRKLHTKGGFGFSDIYGYLSKANNYLKEKKYAGTLSKYVPSATSVFGVPVGKAIHGLAEMGYGKRKRRTKK